MRHFAAIVLACASLARAADPITLTVDASDAPRRIFHSTMTIPAAAGELTLVYPKWIPGDHGPTGPIADVAGFSVLAGGKPIAWRRDLEDMYAIHCTVPQGQKEVEVRLDYLSPTNTEGGGDGPISTAKLAIIDWHLLFVYPAGQATDQMMIQPKLRMPKGWKSGGALEVDGAGETTSFRPVSVTMLIDSPVVCGEYYRQVDLSEEGQTRHVIDMVADSAAALEASDEAIGNNRTLVAEMSALFGARRYRQYHFLLTLSDHVQSFGLEHHESSDNRVPERMWLDEDELMKQGGLLTHEYFHSWNGKFRRPADLCATDFQKAVRTDLLWVYEGLTEYYGDVLAARCGNWSEEQYREYLASVTANLDHMSGRAWRPLQDTADSAPFLYQANGSWGNWRRSTDFYDEGELIWLDADTLIREKTGGKKSLDDFCRAFHGAGMQGGGTLKGEMPRVVGYTDEDVFKALNEIAPHDWKAFFTQRLTSKEPRAPKEGLARAGWRLVYNDEPNAWVKGVGSLYMHSLGLALKDDGEVKGVVMGMAADAAGLASGMKVIAVNGRKFSEAGLTEALKGERESKFVELLVENGEYYSTRKLEFPAGMRIPHLVRIEGSEDMLGDILAPRSRPE